MKIVDVKITPTVVSRLEKPIADSFIWVPSFRGAALEIVTDEGVTGVAPLGGYGLEAVKAIIETELKRELLNEDPLDYERIWEKMYWQRLNYSRRGVGCYAMGVIDIALWDLKGKILKTPCHKLLGGFKRKVKAYRTGIDLGLTKEELVKFHMKAVEEGFEAIKMKVGRRRESEDIERVKAVRDAVGYDVRLMVDANQSWSVNQAIRMAKKLERFEVFWLEEPIIADDVEGLAKIAKSTEIPLALGENEYTKYGFKELMVRGAIGVVIGGVARVGGITEWKKIAAMAQAFGIPVAPQGIDYATISALASIPNGLYVEFADIKYLDRRSIVEPTPTIEKGCIEVLDEPGFGWRINYTVLKELEKVEWIPHKTTPPSLPRSEGEVPPEPR
ncbi:mandelate racemase/muconate lactonizing enzyme family protein [Candidatus Bathyarchaeota archaeon]|nr:mandelate racemase/muconate lactonizing enzyme family protein [Candidatus Bathyarchaeota archaeon]